MTGCLLIERGASRASRSDKKALMAATGILCVTLACALLERAPRPPTLGETPVSVVPESTTLPTQTAAPLYKQVTLIAAASEEHGTLFNYTITSRTPALMGSDDPRVSAFNDVMMSIVNEAVAEFKQNLAAMPPTPVSTSSSFDVRYNLVSAPGDVFSIKFEMMGYVTGAAHPYHVSRTVNFELQRGRDLDLADLFVPGSDYLEVMSHYCISQLEKRDIAFDSSNTGAAPTLENYRNWNITAEGLMITFDEYQVAAYAAGPQIVVIPYAALQDLIENPGPLTPYMP